VVSMGRCKLRLSKALVSYILQSAIGGNALSFNVLQLGGFPFFGRLISRPSEMTKS
jgi:hypothetical protein